MYRLSDSDSVDSDKGIRYKTDSIRNKDKSSDTDSLSSKRHSSSQRERNRSRSRSPRHRDRKGKKVKRRTRERSSEDELKAASSSSRNRGRKGKRYNEDVRTHRRKEETKKEVYKSDGTNRSNYVEKKQEVEDGTLYGPALPTRILEGKQQGLERNKEGKDDTELSFCLDIERNVTVEQVLGPVLPKSKTVIGPALPPDFNQSSSDGSYDPILPPPDELQNPQPSQNLSEGSYGPTLPPPPTTSENKAIGPTLRPDLIKTNLEDDSSVSQSPPEEPAARTIGPLLPPHLRQKLLEESSVLEESPEELASDDEAYGPVPEGAGYSKAHVELEERALKMKMAQLDPVEDKPSREEWMTILPEVKASKFGLGPRQFRNKAGPDLSDRSSWTDTPEDKAKKKAGKIEPKRDIRKEAELREISKRDKEQEAIVKKTRKHKNSLLEIHQKKKLEEKKSESGPSERRPFSRDIDLKVNRFDEAQKKAVLKKAQLLDTRFSAGESKFL